MKNWQSYATCGEVAHLLDNPTHDAREKRSILYYFFEGYEQSDSFPTGLDETILGYKVEGGTIPHLADAICRSCPVRMQCAEFGIDEGLTGVFGGMYLTRGKYDKDKNSHKQDSMSEDLWQTLR